MFLRNRVIYNVCKKSVLGLKRELRMNPKMLTAVVNSVQHSNIHNVAKNLDIEKHVRATNKFVQRTHTCGELTEEDVGEKVQLFGWLQYNRMGKFLILRDAYGLTQCIIPEERKDLWDLVKNITYESVLKVNGTVVLRPENQRQDQTPTGTIEVSVDSLEISNSSSEPLPFNIRNFLKPTELTGMKHRYLVLRFPEMQNNLRLRSWIIGKMREYLLNQCDFIEIETPTLFRRTPGGAHEFVVPTRSPNKYYCLTQSPQQLKQLLMIGGMDRYFQVARCYRDETSRNDRQPEFTQLDIELSFTDKEGVQALMEGIIKYSWPEHLGDLKTPFPRLSYDQAMENYGSENPDLTIPYKIKNITGIMKSSKDLLERSKIECDDSFRSYALVIPGEEKNLTKSIQTKLSSLAQQNYKKARLIQLKVSENSDKLKDLLSEPVVTNLLNRLKLNSGDILFVTYGNIRHAQGLIGKVRVEFANAMESSGNYVRSKKFKFLWVDEFPLFESSDAGVLVSAHHPFTRPHHDDMEKLSSDPAKVRGQQYDLVLNGSEIAGGSIRIHEYDLQQKLLQMLNIDPTSLNYFLNALKYGAPPHGGIAIGLDRYISILCRAQSIRDVIAFPKTIDGNDLMTGAPADVSEQERDFYHLKRAGN